MNKRLLLASPHMSDEGYELEYINDTFRNTIPCRQSRSLVWTPLGWFGTGKPG